MKFERKSTFPGWPILIIGIITTSLVAYYVAQKNRTEDLLRFDYEMALIIRRIQSRMDQYEAALIQTRAHLLNTTLFGRKQMQQYVSDTELFKRYPGLQGMGYTLMIPAPKLGAHITEVKKEIPDYQVWPMYEREIYSSIILIEPFTWRNKKALGYDMYQEPIRRMAMDEAIRDNKTVRTKKIILVQESKGESFPGFNIYLPHFQKGLDLSLMENRQKSLVGYLYSPFRAKELFVAILSEVKMTMDVEIFDGEKISEENLLFDYDGILRSDDDDDLTKTKIIALFGEPITIRFSPLTSFQPSSSPYKILGVMLFGALITFFLYGIYLLTRKQMIIAKIIAREKERLLEKEKEHVVARDDFLSIASHELKTPLTSLKLQAQVMMRAINRKDPLAFSPEKVTQLIRQIDSQTTRLTRLVDDMLDISRIRTGRLKMVTEEVEITDIVNEVVERLNQLFMDSIGELPNVQMNEKMKGEWDRFRIEQVLVNLLTNAIRYGNKKPITINVTKENNFAKICVIDQGIGIAKENAEKIFDRFERAGMSASEVSGLGLGLFITNQIVKAHGGSIAVDSELDKGSTFTVFLPLSI
jgi:two-component system OmpR family sensor kinase